MYLNLQRINEMWMEYESGAIFLLTEQNSAIISTHQIKVVFSFMKWKPNLPKAETSMNTKQLRHTHVVRIDLIWVLQFQS